MNVDVIDFSDLTEATTLHPLLADYTQLTDVALRKSLEPAGGLYIAESHQVVRRALAAGHQMRSLLLPRAFVDKSADLRAAAAQVAAPVFVADDAVLEELTGFHLHRGALAAMHRPTLASVSALLECARRVVVLEDITDHTNVGAIFRACAGLGVDAVLVTPRCADPLYRRSIRVSMGTVFQVPWTRCTSWPGELRTLHAAGFSTAALALSDGAVDLGAFAAEPPAKLATIFGSEGPGLSPATLRHADAVVTIPMSGGVDSLNVAAAAAVTLWALR